MSYAQLYRSLKDGWCEDSLSSLSTNLLHLLFRSHYTSLRTEHHQPESLTHLTELIVKVTLTPASFFVDVPRAADTTLFPVISCPRRLDWCNVRRESGMQSLQSETCVATRLKRDGGPMERSSRSRRGKDYIQRGGVAARGTSVIRVHQSFKGRCVRLAADRIRTDVVHPSTTLPFQLQKG